MDKKQLDTAFPVTVFYSYAHEDETLRQQLEKHLSGLRRQGIINEWHDRRIIPGEPWATAVDDVLNTASIILLLISSDYIASSYCYDVEMQRALERHKLGEATVLPIILRPVDWHDAPFAQLQCLPLDGKPVTEWENQDVAFREIAKGIRSTIEQRHGSVQLLTSSVRQSRQQFLKRVHAFWIEGVLEHSLYHATLIALGMHEQPDAVENPWQQIVQESTLPPHPLTAGTRITEVYDDADGELLILGEPGAGKTTLLLELARDLLERAERDPRHPLPVVLNLLSWYPERGEQSSLEKWVVKEMEKRYRIRPKLSQIWLNSNQILLLLDGLDEVNSTDYSKCVEAINAYRDQHEGPIVVCGRSADYLEQTVRLKLGKAVVIQPLTMQQVEEYLSSAGEGLASVRVVLNQDPTMQKLVTTPLILNALMLAYQGRPAEDLPSIGPLKTRRQEVFAAYVQRMLQRRGAKTDYTPQQTIHWLTKLAQQMMQHNPEKAFSLEDIKPDWYWLPFGGWLRRLHYGIVAAFIYGLVIGLPFGIVIGPAYGAVAGLAYGLLYGLVLPLAYGDTVTTEIGSILSVIYPLALALVIGLTHGIRLGLIGGLITGPINALVYTIVAWEDPWSHSRHLKEPSTMELVLILNMLFYSLAYGLIAGLVSGITYGLGYGLLVGLLGGLIILPFLYFTILILYQFRILSGPIFGLVTGLFCGLTHGLVVGLILGLVIGIIVDLTHIIEYSILRLILWRTGDMPINYHHFLDYAVERILLRKVGNSYTFSHRLFMEYFAKQNAATSPSETAEAI